jgi:hypothetical protein
LDGPIRLVALPAQVRTDQRQQEPERHHPIDQVSELVQRRITRKHEADDGGYATEWGHQDASYDDKIGGNSEYSAPTPTNYHSQHPHESLFQRSSFQLGRTPWRRVATRGVQTDSLL